MRIVRDEDGAEIRLPAKTMEILRSVVEISAELEHVIAGKVIFHFKGRSVTPELSISYRKRDVAEG